MPKKTVPHLYPEFLSYSIKAIARALVKNPKVLLLGMLLKEASIELFHWDLILTYSSIFVPTQTKLLLP